MESTRRTVIQVEIEHKGELPPGIAEALERRAYDLLQVKAVRVSAVDSRVMQALPVKVQA